MILRRVLFSLNNDVAPNPPPITRKPSKTQLINI